MKRSTKYVLGGACAACTAALAAAGWKASHDSLDPRRTRVPMTAEAREAYLRRKGPLFAADQAWYAALPGREEVRMLSRDGLTLCARILPAPEATHRWAIVVHGHKGRRADMASYARHYVQQGWNVLLPDLRCHGESQGRAITMGVREGRDLLDWMELLLRRDPAAQLVLHGLSMGASSCLMASGEATPVQLKAIVSDCAFSSFPRLSYDIFRRGRAPALPMLLSSLVATCLWADFSPWEASALRQVRRSVTPTLFIHGTGDDLVPPDMLAALFDACAAPKEWLLVPGAGHAQALYRDPEHYWSRVDDFLSRHMKEE